MFFRRKRQTKDDPCGTSDLDCDNVPNVNQYRTLDGTCNNKKHPKYGSAFSIQPRFEGMKAVYSDGGKNNPLQI